MKNFEMTMKDRHFERKQLFTKTTISLFINYFTKTMKTLFATALVVLMMLAYTPNVCASEPRVYLNPGFKLGYTFGEHGGFTYGFEVSMTTHLSNNSEALLIGVVIDADFCKDWARLHTGVEVSAAVVGCDVGPSFLFRHDTVSYGISFIPYAGFVLYPYFHFSTFDTGFTTHEVGSYFKVSKMIYGETSSIKF